MSWRYRAIRTRGGVGVCEFYTDRKGKTMHTDPLVVEASNQQELVRVLEMMIDDIKRNEKPVQPVVGNYRNQRRQHRNRSAVAG